MAAKVLRELSGEDSGGDGPSAKLPASAKARKVGEGCSEKRSGPGRTCLDLNVLVWVQRICLLGSKMPHGRSMKIQ